MAQLRETEERKRIVISRSNKKGTEEVVYKTALGKVGGKMKYSSKTAHERFR